MPSATFTLGSATSSAPFAVSSDMVRAGVLPPAILCAISNGAVLTYTVEVTGDNVSAPGYTAANGTWFAMDSMAALSASANATLGAAINAIRVRVSAYTSGTVTMQFVWGQMT